VTIPKQGVQSGPVPPKGVDRGSLLIALLVASVIMVFLFIGTGGPEIKPAGGSIVTVQQPSGWDKVKSTVGLGETAPEPRGETPGRNLAEGLRLSPQNRDGYAAGYVVGADTSAAIFALTRFRSGDVVMTMDGRPLNPTRLVALGDELSLLDAVDVTFERDGVMRKRTINLRPQG
jgi:hypothetical protein